MRKIISFLLIAIFFIVPVSATSSPSSGVEYIQKSSFWTWAAEQNGFLHGLIGSTGASCLNSEDGYHHASSYKRPEASWGGLTGYYKCICDLCGAEFTAYESDLQQSYEAQVEELPATGYKSDGKLLITVPISSHCFRRASASPFDCEGHTKSSLYSSFFCSVSVSCSTNSFHAVPGSGKSTFEFHSFSVSVSDFVVPYTGFYKQISSLGYTSVFIDSSFVEKRYSEDWPSGSNIYYEMGSKFKGELSFKAVSGSVNYTYCSFADFQFHSPVYEFTPAPSVDISFDTTYNINSRPTSITGDYGIIGDNGQIIKVEADKIVNETNSTIYNPATGETHTMSDWSYNYEDRSYTVTTETGNTITITYGDENITIKEGDTIYNVYYLIDGSGKPGPDVPGGCNHIWTETGRTEPTCTTAGKVTSTCFKCNQTKTETIPATGHSWVIDRTVQTTYDEEGNLLQQGYTIYSCSACGEQYKDMEGTGPPGSEEEKSIGEKLGNLIGSGFSGIIEIIEAILGKILDALTSLVNMITDKFKGIVESILSIFDELPALFGGFLDFLAAIFPFLPLEITSILTFGVFAITFIGILKAVRR
jgi:hypothetical protein